MPMPAARLGDMHMCPMVTPPGIPHVGGPIMSPGAPTVLVGEMPAATLGVVSMCVGPPDMVILGSFTVLMDMMPGARMGDPCAHGGMITVGFPTVLLA